MNRLLSFAKIRIVVLALLFIGFCISLVIGYRVLFFSLEMGVDISTHNDGFYVLKERYYPKLRKSSYELRVIDMEFKTIWRRTRNLLFDSKPRGLVELNGNIYVVSDAPEGLWVICYSVKNGKQLWSTLHPLHFNLGADNAIFTSSFRKVYINCKSMAGAWQFIELSQTGKAVDSVIIQPKDQIILVRQPDRSTTAYVRSAVESYKDGVPSWLNEKNFGVSEDLDLIQKAKESVVENLSEDRFRERDVRFLASGLEGTFMIAPGEKPDQTLLFKIMGDEVRGVLLEGVGYFYMKNYSYIDAETIACIGYFYGDEEVQEMFPITRTTTAGLLIINLREMKVKQKIRL